MWHGHPGPGFRGGSSTQAPTECFPKGSHCIVAYECAGPRPKAPPFTPAGAHPALQVPEPLGQSEAEAQRQPDPEDAGAFLALGLLHTLRGRGCALVPPRQP